MRPPRCGLAAEGDAPPGDGRRRPAENASRHRSESSARRESFPRVPARAREAGSSGGPRHGQSSGSRRPGGPR